MADYAKMYLHLFKEVSKAIELLQKAQQEAEEIYLFAKDGYITLPFLDTKQKDKN